MKIALLGYGKMGRIIEEIAISRGHEITLKIDIDNIGDLTPENISKADVALEFTNPHAAPANIGFCLRHNVPVVSGSTGWLDKWEEIETLCKKHDGAFLYSSNYSIGVNIFFEINKKLAALMNPHSNYDITLTEIHHTQKKDAPSGTAITLAGQILENLDRKKKWVNHISGNPDELEIISERVDPAPGTHKVFYNSDIDSIEIIHTAHNRKGFATGAVMGAEFILGKKGIYAMKDVLHL